MEISSDAVRAKSDEEVKLNINLSSQILNIFLFE